MVDLPKVSRRLVTTEAPQSGLSARDIAAPYAAFAEAAREGSTALESVAESGVEDAAARAVTIGADGEIAIDRTAIPMVGKVGRAYERHIRTGALAAADGAADRALIELRHETAGDPAAFRAAAEKYRDDQVASISGLVGESGGAALRRQIESRSNTIYGGVLAEHQRKALQTATNSIDARLATISDEMETLARRNGVATEDGMPSADYSTRLENVRALLDEKVSNPLSTYSRDQADRFLDGLQTRVQGAAINEQMERIYHERGFEAAREYLRTSVRSMDGKLKNLHQIERAGLAWLKTEDSSFKSERDAISRDWTVLRPQVAERRDVALQMRDHAIAVGNHRVARDIDMHLSAVDHLAGINALPARERAFVYSTGAMPTELAPAQREVLATVEAEAARQGVDPRLAAAIAWKESRLGANQAATTSTARGVFQLLDENRRRLGIAADAPTADQVRAGVQLVKETTDQLRTVLGREPTPGEIYLGHFQGTPAATAILQAEPGADLKATLDAVRPNFRGRNGETWGEAVFKANPFMANLGTAGALKEWAARAMGGEGRIDLSETPGGRLALNMMRSDLRRSIGPQLATMRAAIGREEFPDVGQVTDLAETVKAVGTPDQQQEAAELVAIARVGKQFSSMSAPQRQQLLAEINAELQAGTTRFDSKLRAALVKSDQDITAAFRARPYSSFARFGEGEAARATPAIDWKDPNLAAGIIDIRVRQEPIIRDQQGLGPLSALEPAETEALRGVLASGDAKAVGNVFAVMGRLPDHMLNATLADDKVKSAIVSASQAADPAVYSTTMASLDTLYARNPVAFRQTFNDDTWNALATWQSSFRYMTPEQIGRERQRALDPGVMELRKKNQQTAATEARTKNSESIVAEVGSGYWFGGLIQRDITAPVAPPADPITRDSLMADYADVYSRRFAETLDRQGSHQQAIESLKTKWATSAVNGHRLMLRPPEQLYPTIDGDHDWMKPQLEAAIATRMGGLPSRRPVLSTVLEARRAGETIPVPLPLPGLPGMLRVSTRQDFEYALVSDRVTEQEAQSYNRSQPASARNRAPSYQVIIRDNRRATPRWEPMDGRFAFDPDPPRDAWRGSFIDRRQRRAEAGPRDEEFLSGLNVEENREARQGTLPGATVAIPRRDRPRMDAE